MSFKRWIDECGMLLETDWRGDPSLDDSLFRTSLLYIIDGKISHEDAIDNCFYQGYAFRHPRNKEWFMYPPSEGCYNTCSRDQVIMAFVSIFLNNGGKALPRLCFKFSDKFRQTPDMWLWIKHLRGSSLAGKLFCLWHIIGLPPKFLWNEIWWKLSKKVYWKTRYPYYALHLLSWMTYTTKDSRLKRRLQNICADYVWKTDIGNHLLLFLNGMEEEVLAVSEDVFYQPKEDFRWQRNIRRLPRGVALPDYNGPFPIDRDIMNAVIERYKNQK